MSNITELSEAKRALLEKYLRGDHPQTITGAGPIPRRVQGVPAPLSFGQQQLWLLAQLLPAIPVYTECVTIHLPGLLNVYAFERSFNEFLRRHEAWRTSFPTVDGLPVQMIHPPPTLTLPLVDLRDFPTAEREAEAIRLATEDAQKPFDLPNGPLLRAILVHLSDVDHRLFLTLHHIIFDGVAVYQVLLPELYALYEAFSNKKPSPLPPLPIQYADYAVWQREGDSLAEHLAYWKKQLAGAPESLDLHTDHPRPLVSTYRGLMFPFTLSKRLSDALKALSRREGATLFMTLAAAFQVLLYRYTGQDDLLIGTVTAGRKRSEVQKLMGYFLNTLVLRTNLSGNPTFRELLGRVREVTISASAHEDLPFEYLVKELRPERNLSRAPLIQVMLTVEPTPPVLPSGWTLTQMDVETETAKWDLSLQLEDQPDGLIGRFEYSTDLFDFSTIDRMVGHWQTLLEGIVADPTQRLSELPLLTETDRQQLLVEWNVTSKAYPEDGCVRQLFEAQVERTPAAVAVVCEDEQLTYRELNSKANQLAHYLQRLGVGPQVLVGIYMERSVDMVVGLLGILKAGGAYMPLDPTYPQERLAFMLTDAHVPVLLTQQPLVDGLPEHTAHVFCMDTDRNAIAQKSEANLGTRANGEHLAYVIYTSGSTGKPKGVAVEHKHLSNYTHGILERLDLAPGFSFAMVQPLTVDSCVTAIFPTLCTGGCLHVISRERSLDAHALSDYFHRHPIDCLKIAPSHLAALHASSQTEQVMPLLRLIIGGEASDWKWVSRLQALAPGCTIFNHYGPTEATVGVLTYRVGKEQGEHNYSTTPIGRPLANTQVYLLDRHLQPVPIGVLGELYIGGASVARGYLNRPELTAEKFIADPFSSEPGGRLYNTGDLARYLPDGNIEFLGRIDDQVKIRGFRIELGEIETVLELHPAVREAVVVAREDAPGDKRLVAYVVLHEKETATISDLQSHVMKQVPTYMVPSAFVLLEALPMTPHGKVDRRALPAPAPSKRSAEETFVAPTLLVHQQLVQIWEDLLDARPIGIRDNFFDLGGHSLLAARLVARIEQVCGKKIPLSILFVEATIEHLTNALQGGEDTNSQVRAPIVAVQAGGSRQPFFFLHGDWTGGAFYCLKLARELGPDQPFYVLEPYKFDALQVPPTFEEMAAAHLESLRAVQPEGPYLLGGYCNGGLVAYEIARQLQAQGQTVDLLAVMDPSAPAPYRLVRSIIGRSGKLMGLGQEKQLDWFLRLRHTYRYLRFSHYRRLKAAERSGSVQQGDELERIRNEVDAATPQLAALVPSAGSLRQDWTGIYNWVASGYLPDPYSGKITFFWAGEDLPFRSVGWRKVAEAKGGEVEVHLIPGNHITSRTEHLHILAEHLSMCLSKAQAIALT